MFNFDESFWVGVSLILFVIMVARPVGKFIITQLDKRSDRIKKELDEAVRLKEEAQAILALYQRKQKKSAVEAEDIINHARQEAERITSFAGRKVEEELAKRMTLALEKIEQAEASVVKEIRENAVDITISAARNLILENLGKGVAEEIVGSAIADIDKKFH